MARIIQGSGTAQGEDGIPVTGDTVEILNLNELVIKAEAVPQIVEKAGFKQRLFGVTLGGGAADAFVTVLDEATSLITIFLPKLTTVTVILPGRGILLSTPAKRIGLKPTVEQKYSGAIYFAYEA